MASHKGYLDFVLDQLSDCEGISYRAMMGEYVIYCRGKVIGGVYDDRLLIKPTPSALAMMPGASSQRPYDGAKEMLLVDRLEDSQFLRALTQAVYEELPAPKASRRS